AAGILINNPLLFICEYEWALLRAESGKDRRNGAQKYLEIEAQGPAVDVIKIQLYPFVEIHDLIAAADLPETRHPGLDTQAPPLRRIFKFLHFIDRQRTRADQAHIAEKHIKKLRQFIHARATKPAAKWCDPRV